MSITTSLADRMKEYENVTQFRLIKKEPVIIRIDGRAFSKFTKELDKPFDKDLCEVFEYVCYKLREKIDNVKFVYSQSDEISLLLTDWDTTKEDNGGRIDTWYDYRIQKMVSIASAEATRLFNQKVDEIASNYWRLYSQRDLDMNETELYLNKYKTWKSKRHEAVFDARVFNLPLDEVTNYFIYRQNDAIRNSKMGFARKYFSQKELYKVSNDDAIAMVKEKFNIDYYETDLVQQRGFTIASKVEEDKTVKYVDEEIPLFKENREYIEKYLV